MPQAVITITTDDAQEAAGEGAMMIMVSLNPPPQPGERPPMCHLAAEIAINAISGTLGDSPPELVWGSSPSF